MTPNISDIEAIVLTGGASRRMGRDKASLEINGESLGARTARALSPLAQVTILGREPLPGYPFLADEDEYRGPLANLRRFEPSRPYVFVASCDMPFFRLEVVEALAQLIGDADAAVPVIDSFSQPFCALYSSASWTTLRVEPELTRALEWLRRLTLIECDVANLEALGIAPLWLQSANTPEALERLLALGAATN